MKQVDPREYPDRLVPQREAEAILGVSASWLEKDRLKSKPAVPFVRIGRMVRYRLSLLLAA